MVIHFCFYRKSDHLIFSKSFFSAHLSAKPDCLTPIGPLAAGYTSKPTPCQTGSLCICMGLECPSEEGLLGGPPGYFFSYHPLTPPLCREVVTPTFSTVCT